MRKLPLTLFLFVAFWLLSKDLNAQPESQITISGRITDTETKQPMPFVTIAAPEAGQGTRSDEQGNYKLSLPASVTYMRFTTVGYQEKTVKVGKNAKQVIDVALTTSDNVLTEVTVKPAKYRNKNNPAVELIKLVMENRDRNKLENLTYYSETQYEKVLLGFSKMPEKLVQRKIMSDMKVVLENRDTTKLEGTSVIPFMLQENLIDLYSKNPPGIQRKFVKANKSVKFPDYLDPAGINAALQYLNQDVNLYDNYIVLLTDHFLSPIANNAPFFYRYYPKDTLEENGRKIVRLEFYPRNKTDMLLQGELHIALDSTYPVTRAIFTVNPNINLNWVRMLTIDLQFELLPSGKWYLAEEDLRMDFGVNKKTFGIYGERLVRHINPTVNVPLPDSVFAAPDKLVYLPGSERIDTAFWEKARPVALSATEAATYANMDSLQRTKMFKRGAFLLNVALAGYAPVGRDIEIGPLSTFYSFNDVEGTRLRVGMRTSSRWSKKVRLIGAVGYGTDDRQFKYNFGADFAMPGTAHNAFPLNLFRVRYTKDLVVPGQLLYQTGSNTFLTSFVRGVNDKFMYTDKLAINHEREFLSHFSYVIGTEREEMRPAGALHFDPTDIDMQRDEPLTVSRFYLHLRYAPGEKFFQSAAFRSIIDYRWIIQARYTMGVDGIYGGDYSFHQVGLSVRKFTNTPPIGYNTLYLEGGAMLSKAPWQLLGIHRANQSYVYDKFSYNMMNFMEFISDRYVAFNIDQSFYGFFLNKIPVMRKLKWREYATFKILWGTVTDQNRPVEGSGLYYFPTNEADGSPVSYTLMDKPYMEASVGIGNIFRLLRFDLVRRFSYLDHPGVPKYGVRMAFDISF